MRRIGVLGTMVWDTIIARDAGRSAPVEEWGGIAYALSAFEAIRPAGWTMFPIIKVGADLSEQAGRFFASLESVASLDGVRRVREPNNRVTLRYAETGRRTEVLTGAVPAWSWGELAPLASQCDALYINFIAGWELELESARALRSQFSGPIYCDLHSIFLGVGPDGLRVPRELEDWREWMRCFDFVQLNEREFELLASSRGDPWQLAAEVVGEDTRALFITLAERGAAWVCAPGFECLGEGRSSSGLRRVATARSGMESVTEVKGGDPTGCGDVWGISCFVNLLAGARIPDAVRSANEVAVRNASFRGASRLASLLSRATGPIILAPDHRGQ
jgi:sugar/nucleoside kinase (ribokinase family)